jgi:hypothetical protein
MLEAIPVKGKWTYLWYQTNQGNHHNSNIQFSLGLQVRMATMHKPKTTSVTTINERGKLFNWCNVGDNPR